MEFEPSYPNKSEKQRTINEKNLIINVNCKTWYRDSHGLFDYEEEAKMTHNSYNGSSGFLLKREGENIIREQYDNFE